MPYSCSFCEPREKTHAASFECFDDGAALARHNAFDDTTAVFAKYKNWLMVPVEIQKLTATAPVSVAQFTA